MTDKQIIDGVDVSGCAYFYNRECRCLLDCVNHYENKPIQELFNRDTQIHTNCETSPNCYFKQLKRKEQECEELKRALKEKTDEYNKLAVNYDAYVSMANEQLKRAEQKLAEKDKEIERLKQGIKHYQRGMFSIINTATECRNNKKWNYKE